MLDMHTYVVLAYKESPYIEKCINSLLAQTQKSAIFITSSTPSEYLTQIAKKFNLLLHVNTEGGNIARDWNFAYNMCKTKYVTLAHQDDMYEKHFSELVVSKLEKTKNALIGFTDYSEIFESTFIKNNLLLSAKRSLLWPFYIKSDISCKFARKFVLAFGNPVCCPSVTYNKNLLADFKFDESLRINLDWQGWLNLCQREGSFAYIPQKLVAHSIHSGSETSSAIASHQRQDEDLLIFRRLWGKGIGNLFAKFHSLSYKSNKKNNLN